MKYRVLVTIYNSFEVESDSVENARLEISDYGNEEVLSDCDFNIVEVEEIGESN